MQTPLISSALSRRSFVKSAGAATMLAASPFARAGRVAASDRITLGVIGWGMQGPNNTKGFMAQPDCQVVAMCEIDPKKMDDNFMLSDLPEDWRITVDSHSSSPIFQDENTQLVFAAHKDGTVDETATAIKKARRAGGVAVTRG